MEKSINEYRYPKSTVDNLLNQIDKLEKENYRLKHPACSGLLSEEQVKAMGLREENKNVEKKSWWADFNWRF